MSTTTDPVAAAEAEATEAEDLVQALEERVRDGDDTVTPDQVTQQRGLSRFARLRAEAARRKTERERGKERRRQIAALRADIDARDDDIARPVELRQQAENALEALARACEERNQWVADTIARMRALEIPASRNHVDTDESGLGWVSAPATSRPRVLVDERRIHPIPTGGHVADAVHQVAQRHRGLPTNGKDLAALTHSLAVPAHQLKD